MTVLGFTFDPNSPAIILEYSIANVIATSVIPLPLAGSMTAIGTLLFGMLSGMVINTVTAVIGAEISLLFGNVDEAADATDTREPVEQARALMRAADVVFMYSTAMPTVDGVTMTDFTATLCATLRPGTIVITTDKWLDQGYDEAELRVECVGQTEILENPECAGSRCFLWRVFDPRAEDDPSQRDSTAQPNKGEA